MTTKSLAPGSKVWVWGKTSWERGVVQSADETSAVVVLGEGEQLEVPNDKCFLQNLDTAHEEDLTKLAHLHEPGILANLQARYASNIIYTWTGSILIAINPFAQLPELYGPSVMDVYASSQPQQEVVPHIYAVAAAAFKQLQKEGKGQAILVTGESGAGKTETTKLIMRYLAYLGGRASRQTASKQSVERKVLESNPILEAFGNAKTVRNDNSSRFGKYVELSFDLQGRINGAAIRTYLLERSRVVQVNNPERNYHVFYQVCYGASEEERAEWRLKAAQDYAYLQRSTCYELPGVNNALEYQRLRQAMTHMGLSHEEQSAAFSVVASVLHLGNISFVADPDQQDSCLVAPEAEEHLQAAAHTLGVDPDALRKVLTSRTRNTVDGPLLCHLDVAAATQSRDALAKVIYSRLFDWIVQRLNYAIASQASTPHGESGHAPAANGHATENGYHSPAGNGIANGHAPSHNGNEARPKRTIGLLDIYGFEQFQFNDLEQLCINLANEKLQQHFNQNVFKWEQAEYMREGIPWSYIEYVDNQDVLDLVEGRMGLLDLLDEQCRFPRATSSDLAVKFHGSSAITSSARFIKPKRPPTAFTIVHYAGSVTYQVDNFLEKNKDFVIAEQAAMLVAAKHALLPDMFQQDITKLASANGGKGGSSFQFVSVGTQFKKQLAELMNVLAVMEPHYVRCVKPNPQSRPLQLDGPYVLEQLRNSGVMEAVRISCAGYPYRRTFAAFLDYYWQLRVALAAGIEDEREAVHQLVMKAGVKEYQMGHTKVFMRGESSALLEQRVLGLTNKAALTIQSYTRGWLQRRQYKRIREAAEYLQASIRCLFSWRELQRLRRERAATRMQTAWRGYHARSNYQALRSGAILLQSCVRSLYAQRELHTRRLFKAATHVQSCWRSVLAQRELLRLRRGRAATRVQTAWRGYHAHNNYQSMRTGAIWIQNCVRGLRARRQLAALHLEKAAVLIQSCWRGVCARRELRERRETRAAARIQTSWRGFSARSDYQKALHAAMVLQGAWKAGLCRADLRERRRVRGACLVQAAWRGREARLKLEETKRERGAIIIQTAARGWLARHAYQQLLFAQSALTVQAAWRGRCERLELGAVHAAATTVQGCWKGRHARQEFKAYWEDSVRIHRVAAVTLVQSTWRVHQAKAELGHQRTAAAASIIQAAWRGAATRRHVQQMTAATSTIQSTWRRRRERRALPKRVLEIAKRHHAAEVIQSAWRRGRDSGSLRQKWLRLVAEYVELVEATGRLQRAWRGKMARQTLRSLKLAAWRKKFSHFEQPSSPSSTSSNPRSKSSTPKANSFNVRTPFNSYVGHSTPASTYKPTNGTEVRGGKPYFATPRAPDAEVVQASIGKVEPKELEEFQISSLMSFWQTKLTPSPSQPSPGPPRSASQRKLDPPLPPKLDDPLE